MIAFSIGVYPVVGKEEAPDFTLFNIDGNEFSLSNQLGKVVIINFFSIDCYYCTLEMPYLRILYDDYSLDQLSIISISVNLFDTNDALRNFAQQYNMEWTVARDTASVADRYGVSPIPHLVMVDIEGYKRHDHIGLTDEATLRSEVDTLLSGAESGDSNDDSTTGQSESLYVLIAIIGGAVLLLVVGIVVAGQFLGWSEPSKKRPKRKHSR